MTKAQEINIYIEWPDDDVRDDELYIYLEEMFETKVCGNPHPEECPYDWTMSGFIHEAGNISHLKRHVYIDLTMLYDEYPNDEKISMAMDLMRDVDKERKNE